MKLPVTPDITVKIADHEIRLQARIGGMVALLAKHQAAITSLPSVKIIFDCSPSSVDIVIQSKVGQVKVKN